MDFNSLPQEMQYEIFRYLDGNDLIEASRVCKQWKNVVFQPRLWRQVIFGDRLQSSKELIKILNASFLVDYIKFFRISSWNWVNKLPKCENLRRFDFDSCDIDKATLSKLIKQFPLITSVKLTTSDIQILKHIVKWMFLDHVQVEKTEQFYEKQDGKILQFIIDQCVENCKLLQKLDVTFNGPTCFEYFRTFSKTLAVNVTEMSLNCDHFYDIDLTVLRRFTNVRVLKLFNVVYFTFIKYLHQIEELYIITDNRSKIHYKSPSIIFNYIELFQKTKFNHLTSIHLNKCGINDVGLLYMTVSCPALKTLELSRCQSVSDVGLNAVLTNSRYLQQLYLTRLDKISLSLVSQIPSSLINLTCLYIHQCRKISSEDIAQLEEQHPRLLSRTPPKYSKELKNQFVFHF